MGLIGDFFVFSQRAAGSGGVAAGRL